ncbi:MAG TPA: Ig-like domain-containing protein, partial [Vicinamibacteria bacterium]|nr:Ig-like domain-containing protein [Vicinamibacteria bacterium]
MPTTLHRTLGAALLTLSAGLGATSAHAAEVWLQAQSFGKPLPDGASVPMWGFAACGANFLSCGGPTAPGPVIDGVVGEGLTVHVKNTLAVPISLVIPGLAGAGNPPARVDGRYQSFTAVVAAGATRDYSWSTPRPGTFLYQSGTQPSIQVPMGLYGALVVRDGCPSSCVYGGRSYDAEALLLLSEIDPVQNQAVADAVAADASSPAYPGTVRYTPKYFLVNGEPFDKAVTGSNLIPAGAADDDTLLVRLLNAGLRSHVAAVVGLDLEVIAEDANLYPTSRKHSATLLPAGKTHDAFAALAGDRTYAFYDRMLDLTNSDAPEGGMLAYLVVGAGSSLPPGASEFVARDDAYTVLEDSSGNVLHVLLNDDSTVNTPSLVTPPTNGTAVANAGGTFTYTPNADYFGNDAFTYIPINGTNVATVRITVTGVNDVPVAGPDSYSNNVGMTITVAKPGLLGNDQDRDGDTLTASASVPGLSLSADGSFTYAGGSGTFPYQVSDGTVTGTATGSVTFTMGVPAGVALNVVGPNDEAVTEYRWIVEEDVMWHPDPTVAPPSSSDPDATLATSFHKSYLPVVAQGCVGGRCESPIPFGQAVLDPARHYFVSVLPLDVDSGSGHTMGGAPLPPGAGSVTVRVNAQPVPTAQVSVLVFEDMSPTNGAPDAKTVERGLGGFQILVEDSAGRYGQAGGQMLQDAYGGFLRNAKAGQPGCENAASAPDGVILTCDDGTALIQNLPPSKYGIQAVPPAGGPVWLQTSTIEGSKVIDAWV